MPESSENLICLLHSEFQEWENQHPVDKFTFHIHYWSYFCRLDQKFLLQAQQSYPKVNINEYRIHTNGDLWGEQCGVEGDHLWRWNGKKMELLEGAFSQTRF